MSTLRSIRLLNSVEAGYTNGAAFNVFLSDSGRLSEFHVLLAMRGQSRRMASSTVTMQAIIDSVIATAAVFADTNINNTTPAKAIAADQSAMSLIATNPQTLNVIVANLISWGIFNTSSFYEENIKNIISNLAGLTPASYTSLNALIADPVAMASIIVQDASMKAAVESSPTMSLITQSATAMETIADDISAMTIVANSDLSVHLIAQSAIALAQVNDDARAIVAGIPSAITIMSLYPSTWLGIVSTSSTIESNLFNIITGILALDKTKYISVNSLFSDAEVMSSIAASLPIMQAISYTASAITSLTSNTNLPIALGSATAMSVLGPNITTMSGFLNTPSAIESLFSSSAAKGFIVASTVLVDLVASTASTVAYLETIMSAKTLPSNLNVVGATNDWGGLPAKVLSIKMRANNIGAIAATYTFTGDVVAGSAIGATIALKGTVTETKIMGYTGAKWQVSGIAATAAASPEWQFVDMT